MPAYFIGILVAFVEPVAHGWANVLDYYFSDQVFKRLTPFMFWSAVFSLILLPIIWFLQPPHMVSFFALGLLGVVSIAEVFYQYPYYWALQAADTSVVASLFSLGKVLVPILAFFMLGERLATLQYAGFFLIIAASVLLTADIRALKINRAFFFMLGASLILTLQAVLTKYIFDLGVGWGTFVIGTTVIEFLILATLMLLPSNRGSLFTIRHDLKGRWPLFIQLHLASWLGNMGSSFALSLLPVTTVKAISSTQPIFPLIYALIFSKKYPHLFREYIGRDGVWKKLLLFACMLVGTLLTIAG